MDTKFAFITTDKHGRVSSTARQAIRRHCMRDKNKQPHSRRSKRASYRKDVLELVPQRNEGPQLAYTGAFSARTLLGRPPPSDWALFRFPSEMGAESQISMHQYFLLNPIRDPLCSFKHYGLTVDFDLDHTACFRMLVSDELCFYAMLFLASSSEDLISKRCLSTTSRNHLRRTLPLLNTRLSKVADQEDIILLYVIGVLASAAMLFGDFEAAQAHSIGISKLLQLRGARSMSGSSSGVRLAIDRLDFSSTLLTGLWEPIHDRTAWVQPIFPDEILQLHRANQMSSIKGLVNEDLSKTFEILQHTNLVFDRHYSSGTPINGSWLQGCIGYLQSRLLDIRTQLKDIESRCLHLAMMAFLATTFRLPGLYDHPCVKVLAEELNHALVGLRDSDLVIPEDLSTWLLFMSCISNSRVPVSSQRWAWREGKIRHMSRWEQVRRQLKRVMWSDAYHERAGKQWFEAMKQTESQ